MNEITAYLAEKPLHNTVVAILDDVWRQAGTVVVGHPKLDEVARYGHKLKILSRLPDVMRKYPGEALEILAWGRRQTPQLTRDDQALFTRIFSAAKHVRDLAS